MRFREALNIIVKEAFKSCGYDLDVLVAVSKRPDLCQFQSNDAFKLAKQHGKTPEVIANEVIEVLSKDDRFSMVEFARPGFINMNVSDAFLLESLNNMMKDEHHYISQEGKDKRIVMDFGGPNVAKPLHVGHIRSAIIGESMKRIARRVGYEVIGDTHLGDWGLPLGLVIAELEVLGNPEITAELLNEVYPRASAKSKEDEDFLKKARLITSELQKGNAVYQDLWKQIIEISKEDFKAIYDVLGVSFELWLGESDAYHLIPELMEVLESKDLIRISDGAKVVDVLEESDKAPMPPVIVEKSDGSSIYATTDLATILDREKTYNPDKIWYVVDKRQGLHFEQVFRVAKKADLIDEKTELYFLGFGTMNGTDGKPFKTRDGGIMQLKDLIQLAKEKAQEKLNDKDDALAISIGTSAVKFGDLINDPTSDYVFDLDKFLSFEGKTGTYILYNIVRINGLLEKLGMDDSLNEVHSITDAYDRDLALKLLDNPESYDLAIENHSPSVIAERAYQIATSIAKFYAVHHIVSEEDKEKQKDWVNILKYARKILINDLHDLGIEAVEKM